MNKIDFSQIAKSWGSPFVARSDIGQLTGGQINPRTLANLDCLGKGTAGRFRVGRRVAYSKDLRVRTLKAYARVPE